MRKPNRSEVHAMRCIAVVMIVLLIAPPASAELKLFPMWEQKQCPTDTFACYTFDQAKDILKLDLDLQLKLKELEVCTQDKLDLTKAIEDLKKANALFQENANLFDKRLAEKQATVEMLAKDVAKYARRDVFGAALPWVIVVIVVAAAAGFVGGFYAAK